MWHTILTWTTDHPALAGTTGTVILGILTFGKDIFKAVDERQARIYKERQDAEEKAAQAKVIVGGIDEHLLTETKIRTANIAIITADNHMLITDWTEAASALFGWTSPQMIGENVLKIIPAHLRDAHTQGVARYKRTGEPVVIDAGPIALQGLHRDGHLIDVILQIGKNETLGGAIYYVGVITPVPPAQSTTLLSIHDADKDKTGELEL